MDLEQQLASGRVEARSVAFTDVDLSKDGGTLTGYAAVFNQEADLGEFTESVSRGAFRKAIGASGNIPMYYDHNPNLPILASTSAGTLRLKEDGKGLRVEADLAGHFLGKAVRDGVDRGEIRGMSFGFIAGRGNSIIEPRSGKPHRNLVGFQRVLDVSPTWNPAYPGTSIEVRSLDKLQTLADIGELGLLEQRRAKVEALLREARALTTNDLQNTLGGLQSTAEAIEAALNQVGIGELEESDEISPGPFTDEQYVNALETIAMLLEGAEGLLEGIGVPDPDEGEDASENDVSMRSADSGADSVETEAAARKRRLQMYGLTLPSDLRPSA